MGFLQLSGVSKIFGQTEVIHKVDLEVSEGEFLVLVGPSGCGKSTLLNLIAGLEDPSNGAILMRERNLNGVHPSARNMAMVFQTYALYPHMTVRQNLAFGLEMHGVARTAIQQAVTEVSGRLQIDSLLDRKPAHLSGGQRQRVAMGRALVRRPGIFLLDEPLSNLDAKLRVEMRTMIKKLHRDLGTTIIYVTHDQIEAMTLADRIVVLRDGYLQQLGTPREIYEQPVNLFVAGFMGSPSMNMLEVNVIQDAGGIAAQFQLGNGATAVLPISKPVAGLYKYIDKACILGLRPEAITAADPASKTLPVIMNRVEVVEPAGSDTYLISHMAGIDVVARLPAATMVQPGADFHFAINMEQALVFDNSTGMRIT